MLTKTLTLIILAGGCSGIPQKYGQTTSWGQGGDFSSNDDKYEMIGYEVIESTEVKKFVKLNIFIIYALNYFFLI